MNTNTKFPPLPNPFILQYNKHGTIPVPITIQNGNNKPPTNTIEEDKQEEVSSDIHEYYKDKTSDEMIYENKPSIKNIPSIQQPIENVFDLKNFLKK